MAGTMDFQWDAEPFRQHVRRGATLALKAIEEPAQQVWDSVVPVGADRGEHQGGTLKRSWFSFIDDQGQVIWLIIGAGAPYAIHVEFGTRYTLPKGPPQAPLRRTAERIGTATVLEFVIREAFR